jgi:hypothetical protein
MINPNLKKFFELYLGPLPEPNTSDEICTSNPFRDDPNPSLMINVDTGKFNDFGSDFKGDPYTLFILMHSVDFKLAKEMVDEFLSTGTMKIHPIMDSELKSYQYKLLADPDKMKYLMDVRGLSLDCIQKYQLGYHDGRFQIPIRNEFGICVNIRRYNPGAEGSAKMLPYQAGYGSNRLFPLEVLSGEEVILQEGEWDTLIQLSKGFPAMSATAGAGSWKAEWTNYFRDKVVYICYDVDEAGKKGSIKIANLLYPVAREVRIITLPLTGKHGDNDVSDYYVKRKFSAKDFKELMASTTKYVPSEEDLKNTLQKLPLAIARQSQYKEKKVRFDVQLIGKDTAPYNIPRKGIFSCNCTGVSDKLCSSCAIKLSGGEFEYDFAKGPKILQFIKATKAAQNNLIKQLTGIPANCNKFEFNEQESINIEELLIAPEVASGENWSGVPNTYLVQTAYFLGKSLECNRSYSMEGIMTPDPWQQHVTFVLDKSEPLQATVESFKMTPNIKEELKIFQTEDPKQKFLEIHDDFENHVTHIIGRDDLLTGIDLVYHSVLSFNFQGIRIQKGWLEFLCIGDTRTGKSETTTRMMEHFQLGEMSVAENTSFAGLVGGLQQTGDKRWFLTWGKLPLNDGRLFIIDEASGLSVDDISKMSGIRSSGIAEITKIQTERTSSRTRLIWLSNPRSGKPLSSYSYGVQAVPELIGKSEDIARFDFVITAAKGEVPIEQINAKIDTNKTTPHVYTSRLCKMLILWAWSRKPEDIVFEEEATKLILKNAIAMGNAYSARIPLIEGANQRIKIAKLSVAVAVRVFSTDDTGEKVIVKVEHVQFAVDFINTIYKKPSLNYRGFSVGEYLDKKSAESNKDAVLKHLNILPAFAELCLRQDHIWARTLEEQLSIPRVEANDIISQFSQWRMLRESNSRGYYKTEGFIQILREWEADRLSELGI